MLTPNTDRILIKQVADESGNPHLVGENLNYGEVVHPGDTKFKVGQRVFYSIYSAATIHDPKDDKNVLYIVAQDDVMAYEGEDI